MPKLRKASEQFRQIFDDHHDPIKRERKRIEDIRRKEIKKKKRDMGL